MPLERQESNYAELAAEVIGSQITVKVPDVLWSICAEFVYNDDAEISVTQMLLCTLIVAQTQIKCVFVACIVGMTGFIVLTDYDPGKNELSHTFMCFNRFDQRLKGLKEAVYTEWLFLLYSVIGTTFTIYRQYYYYYYSEV